MKNKYLILLVIFQLFPICCFAENITTNEYYTNGKIRRKIVYDANFNIINEQYYRKSNSNIIAEIKYKTNNSFELVQFYDNDGIKILYAIDFQKGKYFDYNEQLELSFKGNFEFEGKQIGNHIVANYINNKRNGPILQYDSTISGKVISNKVFAEYEYKIFNDRVYITHTTLHPMYDDTYSLFKGAYCNFKNDVLDKTCNVFTANGRKKIESNFSIGKCIYYNSYDNIGNTISKINCNNGVINSKIILNGTVLEFTGKNIVWLYTLESIGEIYGNYNTPKSYGIGDSPIIEPVFKTNNTWNCFPNWMQKKEFDSLLNSAESITNIRKLLGIPYFHLRRFVFDNFDKDNIAFLKINNENNIDSTGIHNTIYVIKNKLDTLFYQRNSFFRNLDTQIDNQLNIAFWESTLGNEVYGDNSSFINERNLQFDNWIKSSYNIDNLGLTDDMLYNDKNSEVKEYLISYSDTLLNACFSIFLSDTLPKYYDVFNEIHSKNGNSAYSVFNYNNYYMYNTGYVINSKSGRFKFYIKYEKRKMFMILEDNISKIKYQFEREYGGPLGNPHWEKVLFKIINFNNQELFISEAEESNKIILNNMNIETKQSLEAIFNNFH